MLTLSCPLFQFKNKIFYFIQIWKNNLIYLISGFIKEPLTRMTCRKILIVFLKISIKNMQFKKKKKLKVQMGFKPSWKLILLFNKYFHIIEHEKYSPEGKLKTFHNSSMWISSLVFASLCDLMIRKKWLGVTLSR